MIKILYVSFFILFSYAVTAQQVEVEGELKVTEMNVNESGNNLVVQNPDGTLGTRSVLSLPSTPSIDSTRNLASDYELAKHICDCGAFPPFLVQNLLESGYTEEDLLGAGVPFSSISNANFTCGDSLLDVRNGEMYATQRIGGQCWMSENLNIGLMVPFIGSDDNLIEKTCYNNDAINCETYGGLYSWEEMMNYSTNSYQGICPVNWHIPSDYEFKVLEEHLGMSKPQLDLDVVARGTNQAAKLAHNPMWNSPIFNQDAEYGASGFDALPSGQVFYSSFNNSYSYIGLGSSFNLWTSSDNGNDFKWNRTIGSSNGIFRNSLHKNNSFSVRCVKN